MKRAAPIWALLLGIGGVVLTDGWNHHVCKRAAKKITQTRDRQEVYIEDTPMFVQIAESLGIRRWHISISHAGDYAMASAVAED